MRRRVRWKAPLVLTAFVLVTVAVVAAAGLGSHFRVSESTAAAQGADLEPPTPDWSAGAPASPADAPVIAPLSAPLSAPVAPSSSPVPAPPAPTPATRRVFRITGLTQAQTDNAQLIVDVGRQRGLPRNAQVIAMVTALQESDLRNLANPTVPESLRYRHQGAEADFDSVGLFQQRPSQGWGTVAQLMDPSYASSAFYGRLVGIPGWQTLGVAAAAQAVQRSSFPTAYAKHEARASEIVAKLV